MNVPFRDIKALALVTPAPLRLPLAPLRERTRLRLYLTLMLGDLAALLTGFILGGVAYAGFAEAGHAMLQAQLMLPLFITIALYNKSYSLTALTNPRQAWLRAALALALAAALLNFIAFYLKANAHFSRGGFTLGLIASAGLLALPRFALTRFVARRFRTGLFNVLVIDDGGPKVALPGSLSVDAVAHGLIPTLDDPASLDRIGGAMANMDRVIVSCPPDRRGPWAMVLKACGVDGEVISDSALQLGALGVRHHDAAGIATFHVSTGPLGMRARAAKRLFDVAIAAVGLALFAPVLGMIALAIRIEDGGPVLFRQRRMGRGNRLFTMFKFRSMRVASADGEGGLSTARDDARVTRVGRFLRRTSLDELPQLLNVLRGEMSLVGPRPHALGSQAGSKSFWQVDRRYWQRHALKPGMTGLAQVRGLRGATEAEDDLANRLQADLEYLAGWSLWRDIAIILATWKVLMHERAY